MGTLQSTLKLTLLDNVSARARGINAALAGIERRNSALMGTLKSVALFGASYLGVTEGFDRTYKAAERQQAALSEIAIKADMSQGALGVLQERITALSPKVNQTTADLLGGVDTMLTMGLAADKAAAAIPAIGKAATATKSSVTDLSAASVAAVQNMGVAPNEITKMLDAMTSAGNAGAFEMRDMAQYFPQLTASAKSLGMEGVNSIADMAAALQIARRGAGDASTAANNMSNFLGKLMSPEVSKRFKKFGVDTTKELQKAHKLGISPIEHFIKLIDEKTQGGRADLLGQLFGDKQVTDFVRPMLADMKDYLRIRGDAERASGVVDDAYARRMQDSAEKVKSVKIAIDNLGTSIGANLLQPVGNAAERLAHIFNTLDSRFTIFDNLKASVDGFTKGLGLEGGLGGLPKMLEEFVFGSEDASKAADRYGAIFLKFHEWGKSVREFGKDLANNPIVQFLGDLAPYFLDVLKWSLGFRILAGSVRFLASALWKLSGASMIFGVLKSLGALGAIVGLGGKGGPVTPPVVAGKGEAPGAAAKSGPNAGGLGKGMFWNWSNALAGFNLISLMAAVPTEKAELEAFMKENHENSKRQSEWIASFGVLPAQIDKKLSRNSVPVANGLRIDEAERVSESKSSIIPRSTTETLPGKTKDDIIGFISRVLPKPKEEVQRGPTIEETLRQLKEAAARVQPIPGVNEAKPAWRPFPMGETVDKPVALDSASIAAMIQPSGTQDVRVTNREPPNVNVTNHITINEASNAQATASAVTDQIGQKVKAATEANFSD